MGAQPNTRDHGTAQDLEAAHERVADLAERIYRYSEGAMAEQALAHAHMYKTVLESLFRAKASLAEAASIMANADPADYEADDDYDAVRRRMRGQE